MRPRLIVLAGIVASVVGCGPAQKADVRPSTPPTAAATPATPSPPPCNVQSRTVSVPRRGGVRPDVAANRSGFAVVWEETDETHRGIHFQALDALAQPAGPSVEVADLDRGGAEPRVTAAGDGYLVVWTVDRPDTSVITVRRVDAQGKPLGDAVAAVSSPNARPLAVTQVGDGFALAWWTWSAEPPVQSVSWLDSSGKPRGRPVALARGQLVEPDVDLVAAGDGARAAWIESVEAADHVFTGEVARNGVSGRVDIAAGDDPSLVDDGVVFANLGEARVYRAPFGAAHPVRIADGQDPDGDDHAVCLIHLAETANDADQLSCLALDGGKPGPEQKVLRAPGGVLTMRIARAGATTGIVYQTEEADGMAVVFAAARCGGESAK